jgi:hypothetical protein
MVYAPIGGSRKEDELKVGKKMAAKDYKLGAKS